MALIYRIKRLFKSDLHAFVEGLEDPKWVLAQAIRDIEEELEKIEADLETRRSQVSKIQDRLKMNETLLASLEGDIDFAMKEKKEEIAKSLIKKLLLTKKNQKEMTEKNKICEDGLMKREADYRAKKEAYQNIREHAEMLNSNQINDDVFSSASRLISESSSDVSLQHQVEIEFLKRFQKKEAHHENRHEDKA